VASKQHIYLSPHFGDAVLSCGGQIAQRRQAGKTVIVATVFGGEPRVEHLSPLARKRRDRSGAGRNLPAQGRAEEIQALAILDAEARPGGYLNGIYRQDQDRRRWLYTSEEALHGPLDPADEPLVAELAQVFAALAPEPGRCVIYAPLGVGNHVDHQLVHRAARSLHEHGYRVRFYEDFPSVLEGAGSLQTTLAGTTLRWQPKAIALSKRSLRLKAEAIRCYAGQVAALAPVADGSQLDSLLEAIDSYARQAGRETGGTHAERVWRLRP